MAVNSADWADERLRYQILRFIHDRADGSCDITVSGAQIGVGLALSGRDVLRLIDWLEAHGYVRQRGPRPDVSLTPRAADYLENSAARRRSIRG